MVSSSRFRNGCPVVGWALPVVGWSPDRPTGAWAGQETRPQLGPQLAKPQAALWMPMRVHILVLNYNGRELLGECLPSVVEAARTSRYRCDVTVIDNNSHDDSLAWLASHFPEVHVVRSENRGLCSFNEVVAGLAAQVAVLLNNDIKLDARAIDPLVDPLLESRAGSHRADDSACFMTAPLCWLFDGHTYEGFKTAVRWRWGLVQATALFEGHASGIHRAGLTASAGAAMAVDRRKFVRLGGFDPVYLPGRIEDLDFSLRGYLAGYHARYVPQAVAYHRGMATFGRVFGTAGCDRLALRNTLIFQWKNLRDPASLMRQVAGLPIRLAWDLIRLPLVARQRRLAFARALFGAIARLGQIRPTSNRGCEQRRRERFFFRRFHPHRMTATATRSIRCGQAMPDDIVFAQPFAQPPAQPFAETPR